MKRAGNIESHHTIGFETIEKIDWHLKNLWEGGWGVCQDMKKEAHRKHTGKTQEKKYELASRYLPKKEYARVFGAI